MLFRYVAFASMLIGLPQPSMAQARPDTRTMSCTQVHDLVATRGRVLMTTGRHTYDRIVAGTRFCSFPEIALPLTVDTRNGERCLVRVCRTNPYED